MVLNSLLQPKSSMKGRGSFSHLFFFLFLFLFLVPSVFALTSDVCSVDPNDYLYLDNAETGNISDNWDLVDTNCFAYIESDDTLGSRSVGIFRNSCGGNNFPFVAPSEYDNITFQYDLFYNSTGRVSVGYLGDPDVDTYAGFRHDGGTSNFVSIGFGLSNTQEDQMALDWTTLKIIKKETNWTWWINDTLVRQETLASDTTDTIEFAFEGAINGALLQVVDNIMVYEGDSCPVTTLSNSTWNATSPNVIGDSTGWNNGAVVRFGSGLVSFTVETSSATNMSCNIGKNLNYSDMVALNSSFKSGTTETTNHAMTLIEDLSGNGTECVYCSFTTDGTAENTITSGCLQSNFTFFPSNDFPSISITNPSQNDNLSSVTSITWSAFDNNSDSYIVNISLYNQSESLLFDPLVYINFENNYVDNILYNYTDIGGFGVLLNGADKVFTRYNNTGEFGLELDGFNDYAKVNQSGVARFTSGTDFTVATWIKTNDSSGYIVSNQNSVIQRNGWALYLTGSDINLQLASGSAIDRVETNFPFVPNDGNWHFVVGYFPSNGQASSMEVWVDGVLRSKTIRSDTYTNQNLSIHASNLTLGSRAGGDFFFDGLIDEVMIFEGNLSNSQRSLLYSQGLIEDRFKSHVIASYLPDSPSSFSYDFNTTVPKGEYFLEVLLKENESVEGFMVSDEIKINVSSSALPSVFLDGINVSNMFPLNSSTVGLFVEFSINVSFNPNNFTNVVNCSLIIDGFTRTNDTGVSSGIHIFSDSFSFANESNHTWFAECSGNSITNRSSDYIFFVEFNEFSEFIEFGSCPDTLDKWMFYIFAFMIAFFGVVIGMWKGIPVFVMLSSFVFLAMGFYLAFCMLIFGIIVLSIGVALFISGAMSSFGGNMDFR